MAFWDEGETRIFPITINNVPKDLGDEKYIVARNCDNEYWYYGAYNDYDHCVEVAREIGNGFVLNNPNYTIDK